MKNYTGLEMLATVAITPCYVVQWNIVNLSKTVFNKCHNIFVYIISEKLGLLGDVVEYLW